MAHPAVAAPHKTCLVVLGSAYMGFGCSVLQNQDNIAVVVGMVVPFGFYCPSHVFFD